MEQQLIEDLCIESIGIYGHEVYYIPRSIINKDDIYGEDTLSSYNSAFFMDMYVKSFDSYEGDGTFLSKFNLEIRDQITFSLANRTFANEVGSEFQIIRPREGDLIYSMMMKRLFIIKYVNDKPIFYQMGALQMMDLTCEVFEYSSEKFNTGIYEIDAIEENYSVDEYSASGILTSNGNLIVDNNGNSLILGQFDFDEQMGDVFADNDEIEEESKPIVDWTTSDPFGESI